MAALEWPITAASGEVFQKVKRDVEAKSEQRFATSR
jgi:hypothetical protein